MTLLPEIALSSSDYREAGYVAYMHPNIDPLLRETFNNKYTELRILDAGAGIGIAGKFLQDLGYTNFDALDISQKMLDEAKKLNVYKQFVCATHDALICFGTLTVGHVKPVALEELLRIVKPGKFCANMYKCYIIRRNGVTQCASNNALILISAF